MFGHFSRITLDNVQINNLPGDFASKCKSVMILYRVSSIKHQQVIFFLRVVNPYTNCLRASHATYGKIYQQYRKWPINACFYRHHSSYQSHTVALTVRNQLVLYSWNFEDSFRF